MQFSHTIKFAVLSLLVITALSCRKKHDTLVEIQVKNSTNQVIENATVRLFTIPPYEENSFSTLEMSAQTNSEGIALFNFNDVYQLGQAGVAVLNIEASKDDLSATGIIKIEQEVTSKETVFL